MRTDLYSLISELEYTLCSFILGDSYRSYGKYGWAILKHFLIDLVYCWRVWLTNVTLVTSTKQHSKDPQRLHSLVTDFDSIAKLRHIIILIYIWSSPWTKKYVLLCSSKNVCGVWLVNAFSKFCLQFFSFFFYKKCLKWLVDTQPWPFASHRVLHSYQRMQHYCESSLIFYSNKWKISLFCCGNAFHKRCIR